MQMNYLILLYVYTYVYKYNPNKYNCIKVVEMTADGKFHRVNWMSDNGRNSLMSQLMKDYDSIMLGQQDPDYDSEIDLDRDLPELDHLVSIGAV